MPQDATPRRVETIDRLSDAVLVAVVRESSEIRARTISEALLSSGVRALEITATTPGAFQVIEALAKTGGASHAVLGIGTVKTEEDVARAEGAGASFLVSPHTDPRIIEAVRKANLASIPGAMTPTEILAARTSGADFVKIFPITTVGGARYLRLLRGPLAGIPFWVSGTVAIDEIEEMIEAGASLVGLTTALVADLPEASGERAKVIGKRVESALAALARAKSDRPLLSITAANGSKRFAMKDLASVSSANRARLEELLPERRGTAVRIRPLLEAAGIERRASVEVKSIDGGFVRTVSAATLFDGGWIHYATDGEPLARSAGGPLRLYVIGGDKSCDNVKGLAEITILP